MRRALLVVLPVLAACSSAAPAPTQPQLIDRGRAMEAARQHVGVSAVEEASARLSRVDDLPPAERSEALKALPGAHPVYVVPVPAIYRDVDGFVDVYVDGYSGEVIGTDFRMAMPSSG